MDWSWNEDTWSDPSHSFTSSVSRHKILAHSFITHPVSRLLLSLRSVSIKHTYYFFPFIHNPLLRSLVLQWMDSQLPVALVEPELHLRMLGIMFAGQGHCNSMPTPANITIVRSVGRMNFPQVSGLWAMVVLRFPILWLTLRSKSISSSSTSSRISGAQTNGTGRPYFGPEVWTSITSSTSLVRWTIW